MRYGRVEALERVSFSVRAGETTCLLGDNGAGKSTLVRILTGVDRPTAGEIRVDGERVEFESPRAARDRGIAVVHQDLGLVPLLSAWRNFFLGAEPTRGQGPLRRIDVRRAAAIAQAETAAMGVELEDPDRPVATLSGGERQAVAIARALHFGARVLVLDEPTAALGVRQSATLLEQVRRARERGVGIVLVTHNPHHALPVGDRFVVLRRGRVAAQLTAGDASAPRLESLMAGEGP